MRKWDKRIFEDKNKLWRMIVLRRSGWGITTLGKIFNCDFKAIEYRCNQYGIYPLTSQIYSIERLIKLSLNKKDLKRYNKEEKDFYNLYRIYPTINQLNDFLKWKKGQKNLSKYLK